MSDKSLNQLIETIKIEGIEAAEKASAQMVEKARLEAEQIIKDAEQKSKNLISNAEKEAQSIIEKGKEAFKQAGRDYSISVRNDLIKLLHNTLNKEIDQNFDPETLKSAIVEIVKNINQEVSINLSPNFFKDAADYIHSQLKEQPLIEISEDQNLLNGFSIYHNQEGWAFEITEASISEALKNHLNHYWVEILNI